MDSKYTRREVLRIGAAGAIAAGSALALGARGSQASAVAAENAKPGTFGWLNPEIDRRIRANLNRAASLGEAVSLADEVNLESQQRVEGYASAMSVNTGSPINLHVTSRLGNYVVSVLRIGWYGGAGAREIYRTPTISGVDHLTPDWNGDGLVACNWPVATTLSTTGWPTGYYLAALIPVSTGLAESYVPFVVRDDSSTASIVMQIPFTTYQAYNLWGGKSLYLGRDGVKANKVSFDRPYHANGGTMFLFVGDHQMISWLERNNYPVSYVASSDTHESPALMNNRRVFLSVYHDEYWSQAMRNNLVSWVSAGKSMGMLSANNIYWRVRFEPNGSGDPTRVMACYKNAATDPNKSEPSILFSEVGQNEAQIEGVEFASFGDVNAPWVVTNAGHWIYSGTGLANGSQIAGLVGTEWDRASPLAPADTQLISASPTVGVYGPSTAAGAVREPVSGQVLFTAGTIRFPMFFGGYNSPGEDARVAQMMKNFFARIGSPEPPTTTTTSPTTTTTTPPGNRPSAPVVPDAPVSPRSAVTPAGVGGPRPRTSASQT